MAQLQSILKKIMLLEVFVLIAVPLVFILIKPALYAGRITGGMFLFVGIYILCYAFFSKSLRKTFTFYLGTLHFAISLFFLIYRNLNSGSSFDSLSFLGLPSKSFHQIASLIFFSLILGTAFDFYKLKKALKKV